MTTYVIKINQCAQCKCEFTSNVVASSNTFGAKFYTDGFVDGVAQNSDLLICPGCKRYIWREDVHALETCRNRGEYSNYFRRNNKQELLPEEIGISDFEYKELINKAVWKNEAQEKYIRIRAWWSFNSVTRDLLKRSQFMGTIPSPEAEANLMRLLQLLDPIDPYEIITKAEVLRQLGRFDESLKQLDQPFEERYQPVIDAIKDLVYAKKRYVGTIY